MPAAQRIKGQQVALAIIVDNALQTNIDTIQTAELEFEIDLMEEGYLGETSDRVDSVYKLTRVNVTGHTNSKAYVDLAVAIVNRARNRAGGAVRISIAGTFVYPNGDLQSLVLPDVFFESIPLSIGGRDEFVEFTLSGKSSDFKVVN